MKKLMDLYTCHIEKLVDKNEKVKSVSRVLMNNKGRFEGIKTSHENEPISFIFGLVENDSIEVYDMPLTSRETTIFKASQKGYKYEGEYELIIDGFRIEPEEDCEVIISDGDMIREVQEDEIAFVTNETKKAKRALPKDKLDIYNSYVNKFKKNENKINDPFKITK